MAVAIVAWIKFRPGRARQQHEAAESATIRLVTGIVILPQRNPVVPAKEVASWVSWRSA